jgi:hypothetical protein
MRLKVFEPARFGRIVPVNGFPVVKGGIYFTVMAAGRQYGCESKDCKNQE